MSLHSAVPASGEIQADAPDPPVVATESRGDANDSPSGMAEVERDWLRQAEALDAWRRGAQHGARATTQGDAAGAVDGIKDGKYAFHTGHEPNPWWQVDLGQATPLARLVIYNRLDYAPGLHNADTLIVLTSDDGQTWTQRYDNQGKHFGGISGAKPLEVVFAPGEVQARFVRLQIPSPQPIFFHLDEVEIYGESLSQQSQRWSSSASTLSGSSHSRFGTPQIFRASSASCLPKGADADCSLAEACRSSPTPSRGDAGSVVGTRNRRGRRTIGTRSGDPEDVAGRPSRD
jgi:hypothetical protein